MPKAKTVRRNKTGNFRVLFVAGFGPVVRDLTESHQFYQDALGLAFEQEGDYWHTDKVGGVKHLALWPLSQAAQSCFQSATWPADLPVPQAWLEFDVDNIEQATSELGRRGYKLLTRAQKEPWGQIVTRLISPEGLLVAVTVTPGLRE